jgi:hypothetical protein
MTGKRYNWHKRWAVDLANCTATHDTGMVVRFTQDQDDPAAWDGEFINADEWLAQARKRMNPDDLARHTTRLLREAGDAYLWQLQRRH